MACCARPRCCCSGGRSRMDEQPIGTMNVIPFVDIMLVLLTIVLTTANFIVTGRIPVSLPHAARTQVEKRQDKTIDIAANGDISLDGQVVSKEEFESRAKALPPDTTFMVRADRNLPFQG